MSDNVINDYIYKYNCLKIGTTDVSFSSDTNISNNIIESLFLNGKKSAKTFLKDVFTKNINKLKKEIINKEKNIIKNVLEKIINKIENDN
jgi:hypothetical protein